MPTDTSSASTPSGSSSSGPGSSSESGSSSSGSGSSPSSSGPSPSGSPSSGSSSPGPSAPGPSSGSLARRVALTLALVLAADAAFAAVLAFLARPWLAPVLGDPAGATGWLAWAVVVALATVALAWGQFRYVRRETLAAADARPVAESEYPDLHARLRRLAGTANVPVPTLAVAETDAPNSFAVGGLGSLGDVGSLGGVGGATLVVSTGLLDRLSDDELDAVLAHELAHVQNRDAAVMTLATFLPALANDDYSVFGDLGGPGARRAGLAVLALVGYAVSTALVPAPAFGLASLLAFAGFVAFTVVFGGAALGLLAIPAVVLAGRLSHLREFAADRAGALLAGDPAAMASALETLDAESPERPTDDVRTDDVRASSGRTGEGRADGVRADGVRELCFLPHGFVDGDREADDATDPLAGLPMAVETHPPTDERVARLRDLAAEGREGYR